MSRKKLIKAVKRALPQEPITLADDDKKQLVGYLKLLIEMDMEHNHSAPKEEK